MSGAAVDHGPVQDRPAAVVIGRNEGARLLACLASLKGRCDPVIYVDSGSTDGSVAAAKAQGAQVVTLDPQVPFTAARARNAGLAALPEDTAFVQLIDGDCALRAGWIETALAFLKDHPEGAVACGRRRERNPEKTIYNSMIDAEWDTPIGPAKACGGDALMRVPALRAVGGFRDTLIAGEEPELCLRLRAAGWQVWRLEAEMTWHDAALLRFGQWWQRTRRAGHAFAEGAALHGKGPERHWRRETRRAVVWGLALPVGLLAGAVLVSPFVLLGALAYPAQVARLARRQGWRHGFFTVLGKFAEAQGVLTYWRKRGRGRLIEYK